MRQDLSAVKVDTDAIAQAEKEWLRSEHEKKNYGSYSWGKEEKKGGDALHCGLGSSSKSLFPGLVWSRELSAFEMVSVRRVSDRDGRNTAAFGLDLEVSAFSSVVFPIEADLESSSSDAFSART